MTRLKRLEARTVPEHVEHGWTELTKCNGCGAQVQTWPDDYHDPDDHIHELVIQLDAGGCAGIDIRRDYCPDCLEPVWEKIREALGIPEEFLGREGWEVEDLPD